MAFRHAKSLPRILISHCSVFSLDPYAMVCVAELRKTAELLVLKIKSFFKGPGGSVLHGDKYTLKGKSECAKIW